MKVLKHIYKTFSYIFIGFIVILITLTFGMPDFVSSSSNSNRYVAAKVGDEVLTRLQLSRAKQNFIRERLQGQEIPEEFRKRIEDQIFDQLIEQKVNLILMKNIGIYPIDRSKSWVVANYLKENFSSYFTESSQDFDRFEKEVLRRNQISYSDLESDIVDSYANQYGLSLMNSIQAFSNPEKILNLGASKIKISYQIVVIDKKRKEEILKKKAAVTEEDIQKKFKEDYQSKDKETKLTRIKREAIKNSLYKEKEKQWELEFVKEVREQLKKEPIQQVAFRYGTKIYSLANVSLSSSLDSQKKKEMPSLANLDKSKSFREFLAFSKVGESKAIFEKGTLYLLRLTNKSDTRTNEEINFIQDKDKRKRFLEQQKEQLSRHNEVAERYELDFSNTVTEIQKQKLKIKRFL